MLSLQWGSFVEHVLFVGNVLLCNEFSHVQQCVAVGELPLKARINTSPDHVTGSKCKFLFLRGKSSQSSSLSVQLCRRSRKQAYVTILSSRIPETAYLIFY